MQTIIFKRAIKLEIRKKATAPIKIATVMEKVAKLVKLKANALVIIEPIEVVIKQESLIQLHSCFPPQNSTNRMNSNPIIPKIKVKYNSVATDVINPLKKTAAIPVAVSKLAIIVNIKQHEMFFSLFIYIVFSSFIIYIYEKKLKNVFRHN